MVSIICANCGESFEAKRKSAKYCSDKCKKQFQRGSFAKKVCDICGKEFNGPNQKVYCSDECAQWAIDLQTYRKNSDRYDYTDCVTIGDEEDYLP